MTDHEPRPDDELSELLDEARGFEAVRSRSSRRWLQQQALEEARLSGVLLSAAEAGGTVTLRTTAGNSHTGRVTVVAADHCALHTAAGNRVLVRMDAIAIVQPDRGLRGLAAADSRAAPAGTTLAYVLADQAPERPDVTIVCFGQRSAIVGQLLAVGVDVATVQIDERRDVAYVGLASVAEVWLRGSG